MSRYAEAADFTVDEQSTAEKKADRLRALERAEGKHLEDWHFRLLRQFDDPVILFAWFKNVKKVEDKFYFNGGGKEGLLAYRWVNDHYIGELFKAFGKFELVLAENGMILKSFNSEDRKSAS
jgi:hypothetical protein